MSVRVIQVNEFMDVLRSTQHTLFRLELQSAYDAPGELEATARFVAGDPIDPDDRPGSVAWRQQVREWRNAGVRIERVRVHDDPPTEYQRWQRWSGAFNIAAGEVLRYMTRPEAYNVGLLPNAGNTDWWLLDSNRLMTLEFNDDHQLVRVELDHNPSAVVQACAWRDLAVHHSTLEDLQGIALQGISRDRKPAASAA